MRKLLILSVFAALSITACKKKDAPVSTLYTYSTPTIIISGDQYYSIPVGGALPTITASAYDSFYLESAPVIMDQSTLDNTTPGLYVVTATSRNKYGMQSTKSVYVAVTDIPATVDVSGTYNRTSNGVEVHVTKLANGLYLTDNVGGVDPSVPENAQFIIPAYFVQTSATEIVLPAQPTSAGTLSGTSAAIDMTTPVTYQYAIENASFGKAVRTFVKQ